MSAHRLRILGPSAGSLAIAMLAMSIAGCKRGDASAETAPKSTTVALGTENIAVVRSQAIRTGPSISGTLSPEDEATVRAQVGGSIVEMLVDQGQRVTRGQLLARIDDSAVRDAYISSKSAVTTALNSLGDARRNLQRSETLSKAGAIADRDLEQAKSTAIAAQSQLSDAEARLANAEKQLSYTRILSPLDGVVSARTANAGDVVSTGGAIITVVNPASMRLEASVPADQLSSVRLGMAVDFSVNGYPTRRFTGRVTRINPVADPATRQVRIVVSIPNQGSTLVGGLFADGRVSSESHTAPIIPISAVDERGLRPTVMAIRGGKVQKVEVDLGIRDPSAETVEIRSGMQSGDTILVGAARGISPGTPVKITPLTDPKP